MKKNKLSSSFINIGSSSLLMLFVVISLVTFAILSLSSAQSDYTLSKRLASRKTEYYKASADAEAIIAQIDQILEEQANSAGDNKALYYKNICNNLNGKEITGIPLSCDTIKNKILLTFSIPIHEKEVLHIVLNLTDYTQSDTYYTIQAWQVLSTNSWKADQSIQLLSMEE